MAANNRARPPSPPSTGYLELFVILTSHSTVPQSPPLCNFLPIAPCPTIKISSPLPLILLLNLHLPAPPNLLPSVSSFLKYPNCHTARIPPNALQIYQINASLNYKALIAPAPNALCATIILWLLLLQPVVGVWLL